MRMSDGSSDVCSSDLAMGMIGVPGGGANIFRGHDNVQGATDIGPLNDTLPAYYGLTTGAWQHWARVWDVDYEYLKGRFGSQELMEATGVPVSRWFDLVLESKDNIEQPDNLRAMVFWGHAANSQTRLPDMKKAMRSEEHTSELQSLMRISYAVFCLKKKNKK